ncbi:hypothetical protein SK128_008527 [Halocaridina rubra]|uniref:Histone-lysine N-methyltransferase eggless n=1 Tax=Halocaridina rubra TaxID=373956 RepID=A0AAN8XQN8_HALRR
MIIPLRTSDYCTCCQCFQDMSKGEENVKISCVNALDDDPPIPLNYCNVRLPTEHVPLNLDQDFLVCCDCTDSCQDSKKCACRQLTIQGTRILNQVERPNAGYQYRRLYEQVQSGIYECNSRCMCAENRCSNRVVQFPLRLKLQLFKTARRGWGVRTLCDIPRGGFICVYVGKILSENVANEEGKMIGGDDYYAELDYIEVMESMKEGYEEDVVSPEEEKLNLLSKSSEGKRTSSGVYSDESDSRSEKQSKEKSGSFENYDDEKEEEGVKQRQRQTLLLSQILEQLPSPNNTKSVRDFFGNDESVYIMDAKHTGNIGRYLNHSCEPNVFVQNVFVDTHDLRFPWVSFFAIYNIAAGKELTWDYNYEADSVPGKIKYCYCAARKCRGRLL